MTTVQIETPDGTCDAYLATPGGDGPFPSVLMYMDAIGVRPVMRDMADRLAGHGYRVLLPNLFYRAGPAPVVEVPDLTDPANRGLFFEKVMPLVGALTPEAAMRDARAYLDHLPGPVGVTGYCMGGVLATRTAAAFPDRVVAAASFHAGNLVTDADDSPHRLLPSVKAELYFGHADHDSSMTLENISTLQRALDAAGITYQSSLYAGAPHGFTMSDTAAYNAEGDERHWTALLDLFDRRLTSA